MYKRKYGRRRSFKRSRKTFQKKTFKRKYGRKSLSFRKAPMPNIMAVKLRYCDTVLIDPATPGIAGVHVFRANSLYDPDYTGTGHQPRGFDQLMTMYDHFVVVGARIHVTFDHQYNTSYNPQIVGIALKDSPSAYANVNDYQEGRNVVTVMMPASPLADSGHSRTLTKTFSTRKFLGRSKPLSDPELKGSTSADPTEQAFFHLFTAVPGSLGDEGPINCTVRIEYLAILIEPKNPTQS